MNANYYKTVRDAIPSAALDVFNIYEQIRTNAELKTRTEYIQKTHKDGILDDFVTIDKKAYQQDKSNTLPCVIFAGEFDRAKATEDQNEVEHTGRINIDIDLNTYSELDAFFNLIGDGQIPFIEACARSVSGVYNGSMWANVLIEIPPSFDIPDYLSGKLRLTETNYKSKLHTAFFDMFSDLLLQWVQIKTGSTKDIKRFRYLSYDPDIYVNKSATPLTLQMLQNHLKAQNKSYNKELSSEFKGMSNAFSIAEKFAEKRSGGKCEAGNRHNYLVFFASCLNRMGVSQSDCEAYIESTLKVETHTKTNCVKWPYRAYSSSHGEWADWAASGAPSQTNVEPPTPTEAMTYFKALGYSKDESGSNKYYFYAYMSYTIISFTPGKMSKANLMQLAPLNWWAMYFPKGESLNLDTSVNYLIGQGTDAGFFSHSNLRGRGAWIDNNKVVIHTGKQLIIEGKRYKIGTIDTEFIYEMDSELDLSPDKQITCAQGKELYSILSELNWSRKLDSIFLMGWLGLTSICGVLNWRPHIWITGSAGSGKTWTMNNVVGPIVKKCGYRLEGGTTEAGIRELFKNDAMSGSYDEADGDTQKESTNLENVITLIRSASSSEAQIAKGTGNGARLYTPKYIFAFSSIIPQTNHGADQRRVSLLKLGKPIPKAQFEPIERRFLDLFTPEFVNAYHGRMLANVPTVLANIQIFKKAVSSKTGGSGMGDQLGSMMGAWWSLQNDGTVTIEEANAICTDMDFTTEQSMEAMADETKCLYAILSAQIRTDLGSFRTISELIEMVLQGTSNDSTDDIEKLLKRHGIRVETGEQSIYVSVASSSWIKNVMKGTNWAKDWRTPLERISGASYCRGKKFLGKTEAVVIIPFDAFSDIDEEKTGGYVIPEEIEKDLPF